ncbi:MAG: type I phosphomannose isomerase catalytic subunit [Candidatus Bruticola sp.]
MLLYPLKLKPYLASRLWGGSYLAKHYVRSAPQTDSIGEIWIIDGEQPVVNGAYTGLTLNELYKRFPRQFGNDGHCKDFPLLIKWLRAQQWLSVQVHPPDNLAASLSGGDQGKEEAWYVTEADPGAQLILGVHPSVRCSQILSLAGLDMTSLLSKIRPAVGDCLHIKPGLIHALGPGLTVLEVQQNCHLTYRLYDWDRLEVDGHPRELHLAEATAVLRSCWPVNLPSSEKSASKVCGTENFGRSSDKDKKMTTGFLTCSKLSQYAPPIGKVLLTAKNFRLEVITLAAESIKWLTDDICSEIIICTKGCLQVYLHGEFEELRCGEACVLAAGSVKVGLTACGNGEAVRVISSRFQ